MLRRGGVLVLAWNSFLILREALAKILEAPYDSFEHMVDKAIKGDIIAAKKSL